MFPVPRENIVLSTAAVVSGQDRIIVLVRSEVILFTREPTFKVFPEVGSSSLTVRVQVSGYAALLSNRQPTAIGVSSGTEWAAPTF
jgi:hypothetical protein